MNRVSIVTVTYNSSSVLPKMLESVSGDASVFVVDNASADAEKTSTIAKAHGASFIRNEANLGFGRACNRGAELVEAELILFLNPDIVVVEGAMDGLVRASIEYPRASAFNPAISNPNGKPQFRRSSRIDPSGWRLPKGWPDRDREVSILSGAALLVRKRCFEMVGGFDRNIFLYHEDDDLCLRLRAQCGPLMFVRNARVIHQRGQSSGNSASIASLKGRHMGYSRVYASLKHERPMAFELAVLSAIGEICLVPRLLSPRKRAKSLGYLEGILNAAHLAPPLASRIRKWLSSSISK